MLQTDCDYSPEARVPGGNRNISRHKYLFCNSKVTLRCVKRRVRMRTGGVSRPLLRMTMCGAGRR
jgi:hypothetical protein